MFRHIVRQFLIISWAILLLACGGEGGSADGGSSLDNGQQLVVGFIQKGPAVQNAYVNLYELDNRGSKTGRMLNTHTKDTMGRYEYHKPEDWLPAAQLAFSGYFFDEAEGKISTSPIHLQAIFAHDSESSAVNILTSVAAPRIRVLMRDAEMPVFQAIAAAYKELYVVTGIPAEYIPGLNLFGEAERSPENALLLLYSGALLEVASQFQMSPQQVLEQLAVDFAVDGDFNQQGEIWLERMQQLIRFGESDFLHRYVANLRQLPNITSTPEVSDLPEFVAIAQRPSLSVTAPEQVCSGAGEAIAMNASGSQSSDATGVLNYYWFQVDQSGFDADIEGGRFSPVLSFLPPVVDRPVSLRFLLIVGEPGTDTTGEAIEVLNSQVVTIDIFPEDSDVCAAAEGGNGDSGAGDSDSASDSTDSDGDSGSGNSDSTSDSTDSDGDSGSGNSDSASDSTDSDGGSGAGGSDSGSDPTVPNPVIPSPALPEPLVAQDIALEVQESSNREIGRGDVSAVVTGIAGRNVVYSIVTAPLYGTATISSDGVITYEHGGGEENLDVLVYQVTDSNQPGDITTATLTITITPVNDQPQVENQLVGINEDEQIVFTLMEQAFGGGVTGREVALSVIDPDGDEVSVIHVEDIVNGTAVIGAGGRSIIFTPDSNFNDPDCAPDDCATGFKYVVEDSAGIRATGFVSMEVAAVNDPPVAVKDSKVVSPGESVVINVLSNDSDPDGDVLTIVSEKTDASIDSNGIFRFEVGNPNATTIERFNYTIRDADGVEATSSVSLTIHVTSPETPPENTPSPSDACYPFCGGSDLQ